MSKASMCDARNLLLIFANQVEELLLGFAQNVSQTLVYVKRLGPCSLCRLWTVHTSPGPCTAGSRSGGRCPQPSGARSRVLRGLPASTRSLFVFVARPPTKRQSFQQGR